MKISWNTYDYSGVAWHGVASSHTTLRPILVYETVYAIPTNTFHSIYGVNSPMCITREFLKLSTDNEFT